MPDGNELLEIYRARSSRSKRIVSSKKMRATKTKKDMVKQDAVIPLTVPEIIEQKVDREPTTGSLEPLRGEDGTYVTVTSSTDKTCMFPYELNTGYVYCGRPVERGSYCTVHRAIMVAPSKQSTKKLSID